MLSIAEKTPGYLDIFIEDNGIGRKRAEEVKQSRLGIQSHKSKGKQLLGNRLDLLKYNYPQTSMVVTDLYNEAGLAMGTRVHLIIPILEKISS
jgi:hypothetical protein